MSLRGLRRLTLLTGALVALSGPPPATADDAPRILAVRAEHQAAMITCRMQTEGLPTARALESMQGGLPAAVDFVIDLVDDKDQLVQRREVAFRLAFDLWEEVFRLDAPGIERRFDTIDSLRAVLRDVGPLPVFPVDRLGNGQRYRLRVAMLEHAIAPSQKARVGRLLAGDAASAPRDGQEHEVSFGFGRLIEFFYGRAPEGAKPRTAGVSGWFTREDVGHGSP